MNRQAGVGGEGRSEEVFDGGFYSSDLLVVGVVPIGRRGLRLRKFNQTN